MVSMIRKIIYVILGIALIIAGIVLATVVSSRTQKKWDRCTAETTAIVTSCTEEYDDDGKEYRVNVEFEINGKKYTESTTFDSMREEGSQFTVNYNPENSDEFYIEGFSAAPKALKFLGIGLLVFGIIWTLMSVVGFLRGR